MATRKRAARAKAKAPRGRTAASGRKTARRWSGSVTAHSNALDLEPALFKGSDPASIARSLKRSAERSHRRKAGPFQSAMSMLNFYINRGGRNLSASRKKLLERAKTELRRLYGRT
ncbi:hypothetical protein FRZ61_33840 [Hypericibacter adhaerens]|uniref:DUF3175 domain-containing protein n=1 Tax=Hypericibacter adhaerens TaxID=2602016 RepID=A0A5J6N889_9PROT|nr:DUF3175 domain-containing protein [Hypericibacter adhaerens]QEX23446.1 hypothetical protein FRZ61_33840 [Hypericibacter adhaerens]